MGSPKGPNGSAKSSTSGVGKGLQQGAFGAYTSAASEAQPGLAPCTWISPDTSSFGGHCAANASLLYERSFSRLNVANRAWQAREAACAAHVIRDVGEGRTELDPQVSWQLS